MLQKSIKDLHINKVNNFAMLNIHVRAPIALDGVEVR